MPAPLLLGLDRTTLVVFPAVDTGLRQNIVTQITVDASGAKTVGVLASFFLAQHEISEVILKLVSAHIRAPFETPVSVEGKHYTIRGSTKEWVYGRGLRLEWGEEPLEVCAVKWTFVFQPKDMV